MQDVGPTAAQSQPSVAGRYAQFAAEFDLALVPGDVLQRAKLSILDAIGIAFAATTFEFAAPTISALASLEGKGEFPVIGTDARLPLRNAVLANGTLIHGLDFDDTHSRSVVHASASAVPVMLAGAQAHGASGAQALAAYLLAVELDARIGGAAGGAFQQRGYHPTSVVGTFGAAVAAGHLRGLGAAQLHKAQGIALSFASGSLEFLDSGAWTKRIHPGWAGAAGITAAALAGSDFHAPDKPYEGRFGLYAIYLGMEVEPDDLLAGFGEEWEMLNVAVKPYPLCHFNHAFVDAVLALRAAHALTPDNVENMTARIHRDQIAVVCEPQAAKRKPQNDYDARFSVHYAMAVALTRGRFTLDELAADTMSDPVIQALCQRCSYVEDPESLYPRYYSGEVVVQTQDGRTLRHREAINQGAAERPLSEQHIVEKFFSNADRRIKRAQAQLVLEQIMELEVHTDLQPLLALLPAS